MHWEALECAGRTSEGGRYGGGMTSGSRTCEGSATGAEEGARPSVYAYASMVAVGERAGAERGTLDDHSLPVFP